MIFSVWYTWAKIRTKTESEEKKQKGEKKHNREKHILSVLKKKKKLYVFQ